MTRDEINHLADLAFECVTPFAEPLSADDRATFYRVIAMHAESTGGGAGIVAALNDAIDKADRQKYDEMKWEAFTDSEAFQQLRSAK